jgi:hypothetical protein
MGLRDMLSSYDFGGVTGARTVVAFRLPDLHFGTNRVGHQGLYSHVYCAQSEQVSKPKCLDGHISLCHSPPFYRDRHGRSSPKKLAD